MILVCIISSVERIRFLRDFKFCFLVFALGNLFLWMMEKETHKLEPTKISCHPVLFAIDVSSENLRQAKGAFLWGDPRSVWIMVHQRNRWVDSSAPLMHHDPDRSWITDPDTVTPKEHTLSYRTMLVCCLVQDVRHQPRRIESRYIYMYIFLTFRSSNTTLAFLIIIVSK